MSEDSWIEENVDTELFGRFLRGFVCTDEQTGCVTGAGAREQGRRLCVPTCIKRPDDSGRSDPFHVHVQAEPTETRRWDLGCVEEDSGKPSMSVFTANVTAMTGNVWYGTGTRTTLTSRRRGLTSR